ncbi:MAG: zinc-dependent peptidase [Candidatus Pseudobacter hemicellulosilyticus]|uniref:Zinc-dependent peptidase n=1 Tax=Candidatus Pseudobacter hemicellulosilyticus TaxID=3121375 RepID=A0AAJ6BFK6_9BACT|nr:MAG: zinc-dependent peptidase [Pseudobacter sp.]
MEILVISTVVFGIIFLYGPVTEWINRLHIRRQYARFLSQESALHAVISRYMRFYNRLSPEDKRKFLFRTFLFRAARHFHYIEVKEKQEMSILISAAAVQLTFGLEKFQLGYFRNIYVLKEDYHYGQYARPFQGHVDHSGIYLSWDNFLLGIQGLSPNCNVGVHEMAHALAWVNFITRTEEDKHFKKEFRNFSKIARPIFESMQAGSKNILGEYAGTNYHEFWAMSVELFFENPIRLRHELPELFSAMSRLLRQDPLVIINRARLAAA